MGPTCLRRRALMHTRSVCMHALKLSFPPLIAAPVCFLLLSLSHFGLHRDEGAKDETKHDSVWQPLPGSALVHHNPTVSGELEGGSQRETGAKRETQTGGRERNKGGELGRVGLPLLSLICAGKEKKKKRAAETADLSIHQRRRTCKNGSTWT